MMSSDRIVLAVYGVAIVVGFLMAALYAQGWIWLVILAAANLIRASASGHCPMATMFRRLGVPAGHVFD